MRDFDSGLPCGCMGASGDKYDGSNQNDAGLCQWPIKLRLVSPVAPYFHRGDLLIAADCSAFSDRNFHSLIFKDRPVVIGCPLMDEPYFSDRLNKIVEINDIKSITAVHMDTDCCKGFPASVMSAVRKSGKAIPLNFSIIFAEGEMD